MGIPVILVGRDFRHPGADLVAADNHKGGYEATEHLISLGHKHIGFIGIKLTSGLGLRRFQGYLEALRDHGLAVEDSLIVGGTEGTDEQQPGYSTESIGYEGMRQLLKLERRPTAVFARAEEGANVVPFEELLRRPARLRSGLEGKHPRVFFTAESIKLLRERARTTQREMWRETLRLPLRRAE